jgi:ribosomal protein S19
MTKWKRLFNALAGAQNQHQVGNHLIMFINRAMVILPKMVGVGSRTKQPWPAADWG